MKKKRRLADLLLQAIQHKPKDLANMFRERSKNVMKNFEVLQELLKNPSMPAFVLYTFVVKCFAKSFQCFVSKNKIIPCTEDVLKHVKGLHNRYADREVITYDFRLYPEPFRSRLLACVLQNPILPMLLVEKPETWAGIYKLLREDVADMTELPEYVTSATVLGSEIGIDIGIFTAK